VGRVIDDGLDTSASAEVDSRNVKFEVVEAFKGAARDVKQVEVNPSSGTSCYVPFKLGEQYLVYASIYNGRLFTTSCSGSQKLADATVSVEYLRAWKAGTTKTTIQGGVRTTTPGGDIRDLPVSGVEVIALGDKTRHVTTTGANGRFLVEGVLPGRYELSFSRAGYISQKPSYPLNVSERSCAEIRIGLEVLSRVRGRLTNPSGSAAVGIQVELGLIDDDGRIRFPLTSESTAGGAFEFTKVPPGRYLLGVNINRTSSKAPFPTVLYPGVTDRDNARFIEIHGPDSLDGLDFEIGNRLSTRMIEIKLECADGAPLSNIKVIASAAQSINGRNDIGECRSDSRGMAKCEVLADLQYEVRGLAFVARNGGLGVTFVPDLKDKALVEPGDSTFHLVLKASADVKCSQ